METGRIKVEQRQRWQSISRSVEQTHVSTAHNSHVWNLLLLPGSTRAVLKDTFIVLLSACAVMCVQVCAQVQVFVCH